MRFGVKGARRNIDKTEIGSKKGPPVAELRPFEVNPNPKKMGLAQYFCRICRGRPKTRGRHLCDPKDPGKHSVSKSETKSVWVQKNIKVLVQGFFRAKKLLL